MIVDIEQFLFKEKHVVMDFYENEAPSMATSLWDTCIWPYSTDQTCLGKKLLLDDKMYFASNKISFTYIKLTIHLIKKGILF